MYDGEIATADAALGRVLDAVRDRPTVVVVAADHGEGLGDHGEQTHGIFLYDESVRVQMVLKLPRGLSTPPRRITTLVSLVDLLPSLEHLLDLGDRRRRDGISWFDSAIRNRQGVYLETLLPWLDSGWAPLRALRTGSAKPIRAPRPECDDLARDPRELSNRFRDPVLRREIAARAPRLQAWGEPLASLDAEPDRPLLDDAARSALQALGCLGGDGGDRNRQPDDPKDRIATANQLLEAHARMQSNRLAEGLTLLLRAREDSPRDRSLLYSLGKVFLRLGRIREAESVLREFTAMRPKADGSGPDLRARGEAR